MSRWGARGALAMAASLAVACASGGTPDDASGGSGGGSGGTDEGGGSTGTVTSCSEGTLCDGACVDLDTDPSNCGDCGRTCVLPNGSPSCSAGECALGTCEMGFADCDGDADNGCELQNMCAQGSACPTACGSMGGIDCANPCLPTCTSPAEICNAEDDDCDGACDQGGLAGCRVAIHRAYNATNGHLFTSNLVEAQTWGLEVENFFWLYNDAAADLRPFFRCTKPGTGNYLLTESNDCELTGAPQFTVGFIAPSPQPGNDPTCGAVPLYRLSYGLNSWHFYTTSAPERDSAVAGGWADEGVAGYVYTSP